MSKHKVVVVGGGFAGVRTALALARNDKVHVTLVSSHADFRYYPTLYRTATGGRKLLSSIPLAELFHNLNVTVIKDRVTSLDRQSKEIGTESGRKIAFDNLVLAMGVKTNYFHIEGLEQYSYGIKTITDAERLKKHIHQQMIEDNKVDINYVVIGGGPTGVELAGILPQYLCDIAKRHNISKPHIHVDLIEASNRLLPRMPKDVSRTVAKRLRKIGVKLYLGVSVQAQNADALTVNNKKILSHSVIWTAGVTNNAFFSEQQFQLNKNGKVRVDQFLQAEPNIYVIGDNADTPYSGMAQTALYDGYYVAKNIGRIANKKDPKPYIAKKPIYVVPAGPKWAAVLWGSIRIYGRLGWLVRRFSDLLGYHDYEPWYHAGKRWMAEDDDEEPCILCSNI